MTPPLKFLACTALLAAAALAGCNTTSSTEMSATASALTGSIDQATFPTAVASITVARNDGTTANAAVLDDGTFSIALESGGTYRLLLSADGVSTPVVLDTSGGRLRTEIQISSGGGAVNIGKIRYWDPAAESVGAEAQALIVDTTVTTTPTTAACVDGVIERTTQPCAAGSAPVDCSVAKDMSNGCPDIGDTLGSDLAGTIATTITSANDADAAEPMGIPTQNAPALIHCASEGGGHGPRRHRGH
jgi:hypothetical protein